MGGQREILISTAIMRWAVRYIVSWWDPVRKVTMRLVVVVTVLGQLQSLVRGLTTHIHEDVSIASEKCNTRHAANNLCVQTSTLRVQRRSEDLYEKHWSIGGSELSL